MYIAAGVIAAAAIAVFVVFVVGPAGLRFITGQNGNGINGGNSTSTDFQATNLGLSLNSVSAVKQDPRNAKVKVSFEIHNPNTVSVLLENVHYTLTVDKHQMTLGDTGEPLEGFLASQASSTLIVSGGNVTVNDNEVVPRNNLTAAAWDNMVNGTASFIVDGYYSFRATQSLQTSYVEKEFHLTFHWDYLENTISRR